MEDNRIPTIQSFGESGMDIFIIEDTADQFQMRLSEAMREGWVFPINKPPAMELGP